MEKSRTALCLEMLKLLSSTNELLNTTQLADQLHTNPRNIREFKRVLEDAGYPIETISGRYGGYKLDRQTTLPSAHLTESEMAAINEVKQRIQAQEVQVSTKQNFMRAMAKVQDLQSHQEMAVPHFIGSQHPHFSESEDAMIQLLWQAKENHQVVRFLYKRNPRFEEETTSFEALHIDPYEIVYWDDSAYVVAYCHERLSFRTYKIIDERMKNVEISASLFTREPDFHIEQHVGKDSIIKDDFVLVKVKVDPRQIHLFTERYWGVELKEESAYVYSFKVQNFSEFYKTGL